MKGRRWAACLLAVCLILLLGTAAAQRMSSEKASVEAEFPDSWLIISPQLCRILAPLLESRGLDAIMMANHGGDHAIYPDCRPEFVDAFGKAVEAGTYNGVKLLSPYCDITKRDIALRGKALGIDYSLTYSCYKGGEKHCGKCGTCTERKEALEGFDPTEYED